MKPLNQQDKQYLKHLLTRKMLLLITFHILIIEISTLAQRLISLRTLKTVCEYPIISHGQSMSSIDQDTLI